MKTLEQLQREQAEQLARLTVFRQIADQMPIEPEGVSHHVRSLPVSVTYVAESLLAALSIYRKFDNTVPFVHAVSTFSYLRPWELLQKEDEKSIRFEPGAFYLEVRQGDGYGPGVSMHFFTRIASGEVVSVTVKVTNGNHLSAYPGLSAQFSEIRDSYRGHVVGYEVRPNILAHSMADNTVRYSTGGNSVNRAADYRYLFTQSHAEDLPAEQNEHAIAQLHGLAHQLGEETES